MRLPNEPEHPRRQPSPTTTVGLVRSCGLCAVVYNARLGDVVTGDRDWRDADIEHESNSG